MRIIAALAIVLGIMTLIYLLWQPGSDKPLPEYSNNAVWLGHGYLGDDSWFIRNRRNKNDFRDEKKITFLFEKLSQYKISTVYPHLCPTQSDGRIAPYDDMQVERFLTIAGLYKIKVIPWIGGVLGKSARINDEIWRKNFIASVDELLKKHPRLAGVQVNIEPMPNGNVDFLKLLDGLRPVLTGKTLSVAAYPPPTKWQPVPDVHWEKIYIHRIARHCDQLAVMMYDTAIPLKKFYIHLMTDWTKQLIGATHQTGCELLLGIPAYDDTGVGYHHPEVENISSALQGISAAGPGNRISGIALYCEWEMSAKKWQSWKKFIR